jgi:seryl-tRNA synthetase
VLDIERVARNSEDEKLRKEIKKKDDIIQNLNKGFNQKFLELKLEISALEDEKKELTRKEKKLQKKIRQKTKKEAEKEKIQAIQVPDNRN